MRFWTYGAKGREFRLLSDDPTPAGQHLVIEVLGQRHEIELPLVGGFQASNALARAGSGRGDRRRSGPRRRGPGDA
mgnify:CR=1 FL=1